jgi:DNA helicase HerA-like ATPase
MIKSPPLHMGWLLDIVGTNPLGVPINLKAPGLKSHTAIIAQSGSGKSFMLGRLLEEIASKTQARIVILDPNSDFVKFSEVDEGVWKDSKLSMWFGPEDSLDLFRKRWATIGFKVITNRHADSPGLRHPNAQIARISLSWGRLSLSEQASYLGFTMATHPGELLALNQIRRLAKSEWKEKNREGCFSLGRFLDWAAALWVKACKLEDSGPPLQWPVDKISLQEGEVSCSAALNVYGRVHELESYNIWDLEEEANSLPSHLQELGEDSHNRVLCIDLASLERTEERLSVAYKALDSLWKLARQKWLDAIKKPAKEDDRHPFFIVVDEAHNLAPAEPGSILARSVNDTLVRIATEGRKYGLFLILATQRPSRLEQGVLSQCDNLCLAKMNNRIDLELVRSGFGFVPTDMVERAVKFAVGDALFSGNLIEKSVCAHVAPRRTAEGGRNLQDTFWLQDPC